MIPLFLFLKLQINKKKVLKYHAQTNHLFMALH